MPCYAPLTAYYSKDIGKSGKRGITFDRGASFSGVPIRVPCGQCIGCRLEYSRQWAIRCMHEKKMHDSNCFVTLTYDDEHLPEGGTLVKRDLQLFMKRLRKEKGAGIRFYACGEYGERSWRPHYHAILFNCRFEDASFYKNAKNGEKLYTSDELYELWPMGHNVIGDVTFESCAYVARYVTKKVTGDNAAKHYERVDPRTGEVYWLQPEFVNMSRKPGIGKGWFDKYKFEAYRHDSVIMRGREVRPPRYYDDKYELLDSGYLARLKRKRRRKALRAAEDNTPERRKVREKFQLLRLKQAKREF